MTWHPARIIWLSAAEGGRQHQPRGALYSSAARCLRRADRCPNEVSSLVVEGLPDAEDITSAEVRVRLLTAS